MCVLPQDSLFVYKRYFLVGRRGVLWAFKAGELFWNGLLVWCFPGFMWHCMSSEQSERPLQLSHLDQSSVPRGESLGFLWEFVMPLICSLIKCQLGCFATLKASFLHSRSGSFKTPPLPASVVSLQWLFQEEAVACVAFFFLLFFFC